MINWIVKSFDKLSISELYEIVHLRAVVFVVEQERPCLDPDNKDQKALHLLGYDDGELVAYCRLFAAGDYLDDASIGRVVVAAQYRRLGYGHLLMDRAIEVLLSAFGNCTITISAQMYLQSFYESHGFEKVSEQYLEDGIPHIRMKMAKINL